MISLSKLLKGFLGSFVILCLSPFILYGIVMSAWKVEYTIEKFFRNQAISRATSVIEPFYVDGQSYDITTVMLGIANSQVEYSNDGSNFTIDRLNYHMDSSVFHHYCSTSLQSYNREEHDIDLINDICTVLNGYNLDYNFIEGYGYRGFFYGDGYVYGRYDTSYLNGQYLEISLRPLEGKNIVLRFDLQLDPASLDYQIISDLKSMEHASHQDRVNSIHNILEQVTPLVEEDAPQEEKQPQILVIS